MVRRALVLGAGGFLGAHLCRGLLADGWEVVGVARDTWTPTYQERLGPIVSEVRIVEGDAADPALLAREVRGVHAVFPFLAASGAAGSMAAPEADLATNAAAQLNVLQALRAHNPCARVVYPGSRLQYGRAERLPVAEGHPMRPTSIYGAHKSTAEHYYRLYHDHYGIPTTCLRISSPYGPLQDRPDRAFGIVGTFLGLAARDETISLYGGGTQLRDYVFVDDLVALLLLAVRAPAAIGQIYNAGGSGPISLREMAETVVRVVGRGRVASRPWPAAEAAVETGDFVSDISRVVAELGWRPTTSLADGLTASWAALPAAGLRAR